MCILFHHVLSSHPTHQLYLQFSVKIKCLELDLGKWPACCKGAYYAVHIHKEVKIALGRTLLKTGCVSSEREN